MSGEYRPSAGAVLEQPWDIAFLSQRDLSLQIPINYVPLAGVVLRAACFGHDVYEEERASRCVSNLLAAGFRRFVLDLYWDTTQQSWNFCPAQIPNSGTRVSDTSSVTSSATEDSSSTSARTSSVTFSSVGITGRNVIFFDSTEFPVATNLIARQTHPLLERQSALSTSVTTSTSGASSSTSSRSSTSSTRTTSVSSSTKTQVSQSSSLNPLYTVGPYQCSASLSLETIAAVFASYLERSSTDIGATTMIMVLNLHVAAPASNATGPALQPTSADMPSDRNLMSNVLRTNLSSYLFTPKEFFEERLDLNTSWYQTPLRYQPDTHYYNATKRGRVDRTQNGWPSEGYIEFKKLLRLLVVFGSVDPQLADYDFEADEEHIFPTNYLSALHDVSFASNGTVSRGCFADPSGQTIAGSNNSWAETVVDPKTIRLNTNLTVNSTFLPLSNLTSCGSSLLVNNTMLNVTADNNFRPYAAVARSSIWSWAVGEPRHVDSDENDASRKRCAVLDLNLGGRWRVENCNSRHHGACRTNHEPFSWSISDDKGTYGGMSESGCGDGQDFSAPRTGIENVNLYSTFLSQNSDNDDLALWVDFNSLDVELCWVRGYNETCPYDDHSDDERTRKLIVPVVAGVIVFVVAALMLLVKCAANRQTSKRRRIRKGDNGWDYEGVPS